MTITYSTDLEFNKRLNEVNYFFSCLETLYNFFDQKQSKILKDKLNSPTLNYSDFMVILKSNAYLMLYNLIESTVRTFMQKIYDEITIQNLGYSDIRQELQKIWVDVSYDTLGHTTTNFNQHKDKAIEMISFVIGGEKISLTEKDINLSGNVDIRVIKELFKNHGLMTPTNHGSNVGAGLREIKVKRNTIAHGNVSFIDSARDSALEDLEVYKNEIIDYLKLLNQSVTDYIDNQQYRFVTS
ncbi:MAE_28990/MAE_18760 family HEPN-like nuclease [Priestia sp. J2]|uniref:MAE_28990/MAE_18760 family HEPN-like nuclease n=1 Tax=Priestia sp. J2 TaxID=2886505 RepID=UPI001E62BB24|nr:MAE_28990/MAE_18760 family HEPN-like nuclease [Priestia sp. J2]